MDTRIDIAAKPPGQHGYTVSTATVPPLDRLEWLHEVIRQEYTKVEVRPPAGGGLFNEMTFYAWEKLRLSVVHSHALTLNRLAQEPYHASQDNYLGVVALSGDYRLEQDGRETVLQPGDLAIYDATRPHRIQCSRHFSKLIVSIPRPMMRERIAGVEHCTAIRIPSRTGIGAVASEFIRSAASQAGHMDATVFGRLSDHALDLMTLALASVRPQDYNLSRSRSLSLHRVKDLVERHLSDPALDTTLVAAGAGLSARYINDLFREHDTSLMRYVWQRRLDQCHKDLLDPLRTDQRVADIAMRWGFNDLSHFSRAFKIRFGDSPRGLKNRAIASEPK
jgi:AraC-like DNA-binding protein